MLIGNKLSPNWPEFKGLDIILSWALFLSKVFLLKVLVLAIITISSQASAEDMDLSEQAAQQTAACFERSIEQILSRWRQFYLPVASELRACGDLAVPGLVEAMADESLELRVRQFSARILAQIGSEEAVMALLDASHDDALQSSIYQAARSLHPNSPATSILLEALATSEPSVATTAALGLAQIGSPEAVGGLLEALRDEATREAAFIGLGEINSDSEIAVEVLTAALEDESEVIQVGAAYGLAEIGPNAEVAIPKLADILRVSEAEYSDPEKGSEARAMAAYALGKINPLHVEALKALGITTNLVRRAIIETVEYYPEPIEEVKEIAAEALNEIDNILFLLNWNNENYEWHMIALGHQSDSKLLEAFNEVFLERDIDSEIPLRIIKVIHIHYRGFMALNDQHNSLLYLSNLLLSIIEDKSINIETKRYAVHVLSRLMTRRSIYYEAGEGFILSLTQIIENEKEDIYVRRGATLVLYALIHNASDDSFEFQNIIEELIRIAESSHLRNFWHEDYEHLQSQEMIDWDDVGVGAMAILLDIKDWSFCPNRSLSFRVHYDQSHLLSSSIFLSQLEQENLEFFRAVCQNARLPDDLWEVYEGGSGVDSPALAMSVSQYQRRNQPAICRYGIAQRLVPRCR